VCVCERERERERERQRERAIEKEIERERENLASKTICYPSILAKLVWSKGRESLSLLDVHTLEKPLGTSSPVL
jgi:hypothetical protein